MKGSDPMYEREKRTSEFCMVCGKFIKKWKFGIFPQIKVYGICEDCKV